MPEFAEHSLSGAQIAQLANNYKLTPATLMSELCDWWYPAPFLQYLGAEIASAIARGGCGLLVSAPPRHGKSKLITVATPLWTLENFPKKNVIVATYGEDLSTDFTREVKDLIKNNRGKLTVGIRRDVDRAQNFVTPQGGGLKAVGLRGTITGRGADVLIIDDYIKEPKEALNHNYLESLKTWYATVARTRLEPGAVVIIVATRWVTNDLHGHIERLEMRRQRKFYKVIKIPAISGLKTEDGHWIPNPRLPEILDRQPGEALFPARYNKEQLEDIIDELGMRWFQAMFQQDPQSQDSAITNPDNLRFISKAEFEEVLKRKGNRTHVIKRSRSWDFAGTKDAGDFTCGLRSTYFKDDEDLYLEGAIHGQYSSGRVEAVYTFASGPEGDPPEVEIVLEQEPGSAGIYSAEHFKKLAPTRKVRIVKSAAEGSKLLKAQPFLAHTERKKVYLVVNDPNDLSLDPWVAHFIDQFAAFPEGAYDDYMDAASNAYNDHTGKKFVGGTFGRSARSLDAQKQMEANGGAIPSDSPYSRGRATFGRLNPETARPKRRAYFGLGGSR